MDTENKHPLPTVRLAAERLTRRQALGRGALGLAGGVMMLRSRAGLAQTPERPKDEDFDFEDDNPLRGHDPRAATASFPPGEPGRDYTPVVTPNGWTLPYTIVDGAKVFHLVAEEVEHEFAPGLSARCWGYNGSVHGPVIEAVEGDRVRIFVTNKLAAPTTVHWHGILLPSGMDGVGGLSQRVIRSGETYLYEFPLIQHGTYMYHSHHDEMTQMGMGMVGLVVIHPRNPQGPRPDRDFALLLHEWAIEVGTDRPNPNEMTDFNVLTINARAFPGTDPLVARLGDRVRIRIGNLSAMDHHPIHLHGYYFKVTETDGGRIPDAGQWPETTVLVPVGATRTIEFVADNPGDWAMHCHMTHHVMNQMGHEFPNMIGVDAGGLDDAVQQLLPDYMTMGQEGMGDMAEMGMRVPENSIPMVGAPGPHDYITMGGMFTILKVRKELPSYDDPGWYENPPGTLASLAPREVLRKHGISPDGSGAPKPPTGLNKAPRISRKLDKSSHRGHHHHGG
ncbi:multicopper oxidase family protein [Tautonia sociabilis]|uniref:Copper oxidase n=1 Tax=Tautonia sociabilis TaxID=2080755 RepID=A0A432ME89_9BACT|nr:copper oxidase [Tautonia sociabilis]RUL83561.1 copper oxidase [Tautonia sociabilis]